LKIGVLVSGDVAVRAAYSLAAHPGIDEVVVVGPARSRNFPVVPSAEGCDYLVGSGAGAPARARRYGIPLIWDGESGEEGVAVWGGSPQGLTLALAARESDPRLVAGAHPALEPGSDTRTRFPRPLGSLDVADNTYAGKHLFMAQSPNPFAACLAVAAGRRVTIIDDGAFLAGIALAAVKAVVAAGSAMAVAERGLPTILAMAATPAAEGDRVFFVTEAGTVYARSADSNSPLWQRSVPGRLLSDPIVTGDTLLVAALDADALVTAFDADTGSVLWSFTPEE
jgi:hypothetical protein